MTKLELEIHDDIISSLDKIRSVNDTGVELVIPKGSVLFENILNLKLIKQRAELLGTVLHFNTDDDNGSNLIEMVEEDKSQTTGILPEAEETASPAAVVAPLFPKRKFFDLKRFRVALPKIRIIFAGAAAVILLGAVIFFVSRKGSATVRVVVNSQPLARSVKIRVVSEGQTDPDKQTLKGVPVQGDLEETTTIDTTGSKIIGEKAKGSATLYNNTDLAKEMKKGTVLTYEDLKYVLTNDVTIPKRTLLPEDPENPGITTYQKGESTAEIEANDIGASYNISSGKDLKFKDYDKSEFSAKTKEDIKGGKSETVRIIAASDKKTGADQLLAAAKTEGLSQLQKKVGKKEKLIDGSVSIVMTKETYSGNTGDQADKLTITQTFLAVGLAYSQDDLNSLVDKLVAGAVPEGFVLYSKERSVNVEVLGNSTDSILNSTAADLQVTLKTYVIPNINETDIANSLTNKKLKDAQKYLGSIRNVKTYELKVVPNIPFLARTPKDAGKIHITMEKE